MSDLVSDSHPGPTARTLVGAIEWYQRAFEGRLSPCRFFPSCSEYGHEAITVHGAGRGLWLTVRRLIRCRPFGPSGFDPVPLPRVAAGDRAHLHCEET
jgi:putative membrane protein insertion efficiency factor